MNFQGYFYVSLALFFEVLAVLVAFLVVGFEAGIVDISFGANMTWRVFLVTPIFVAIAATISRRYRIGFQRAETLSLMLAPAALCFIVAINLFFTSEGSLDVKVVEFSILAVFGLFFTLLYWLYVSMTAPLFRGGPATLSAQPAPPFDKDVELEKVQIVAERINAVIQFNETMLPFAFTALLGMMALMFSRPDLSSVLIVRVLLGILTAALIMVCVFSCLSRRKRGRYFVVLNDYLQKINNGTPLPSVPDMLKEVGLSGWLGEV